MDLILLMDGRRFGRITNRLSVMREVDVDLLFRTSDLEQQERQAVGAVISSLHKALKGRSVRVDPSAAVTGQACADFKDHGRELAT